MAIAATLLTSNATPDVDGTTFTTASISPAANALIVVCATSAIAAGTTATVVASSTFSVSTSWAQEKDQTYSGATVRRVAVWRAVTGTSPGSGTVTVDWSVSSTSTGVWVVELTGVDTATPIVQSVSAGGSDTTPTVTLAAGGSDNRPFSFVSCRGGGAVTPRANWTELADLSHASPTAANQVQWRSDAFETTADCTLTTGDWGIIALEVAASAGAPPAVAFTSPIYAPINW